MALALSKLRSPLLLAGTDHAGYRDPAAWFQDGVFHLFATRSTIGPDGLVALQTIHCTSADLLHLSPPEPITPRDRALNYSSPGSIIRDAADLLLCLQTYPTPRPEDKYGNQESRLWTMRSRDLQTWDAPELLRVEGPSVPWARMARLIDPFLLDDRDCSGLFWCFYKREGQICCSTSRDLVTWKPGGAIARGENPCVIRDGDGYALFLSPENGIGVLRSPDLQSWHDGGLLQLDDWDWAQGRLSAGFVLDLRHDSRVGKALLFFHGSRWPENDPRGGWANWVSVGIAWSDDLIHWSWPGKPPP